MAIVATLAFCLAFGLLIYAVPRLPPALRLTLVWSLLVRLTASFVHHHVRPLGASADEASFHRQAADWSTLDPLALLLQLDLGGSYVFSWLGAWVYKATYADAYLMQLIVVSAGVGVVWAVYFLTLELSRNSRLSVAASLLASLWPSLIIYSAILLRDQIVILFLSLSALYTIRASYSSVAINTVFATIWMIAAASFHGGFWLLAPLPAFLALSHRVPMPIRFSLFVITIGLALLMLSYPDAAAQLFEPFSGKLSSKFREISAGGVTALFSSEKIRTEAYIAHYPEMEGGVLALIPHLLLRLFYFITTPWISMAEKVTDIPRLLDAAVSTFSFAFLTVMALFVRDVRLRAAFAVVLFTSLLLAAGTLEVGTGVRHRLKVMAVVLSITVYAAQMLLASNTVRASRH